MADEQSQVSGGAAPQAPPAVVEKPSPASAGGEQASPALAPAAQQPTQEHRPSGIELARYLANLPPQERRTLLAQLSPEELLQHPQIQQQWHQWGQSQFDKGRARAQRELFDQTQRQQQKQMDSFELGEQRKRELEVEETAGRLREGLRQQLWEEMWPQAVSAAEQPITQALYSEIGRQMYEVAQEVGVTPQEWETIVRGSQNLAKVWRTLTEEGATRKSKKMLDAELKKIEQRAGQERDIEARGGQPNPDVDGGSPSAGRLSRQEYEGNRHNRQWVERNMERLRQAATNGFA